MAIHGAHFTAAAHKRGIATGHASLFGVPSASDAAPPLKKTKTEQLKETIDALAQENLTMSRSLQASQREAGKFALELASVDPDCNEMWRTDSAGSMAKGRAVARIQHAVASNVSGSGAKAHAALKLTVEKILPGYTVASADTNTDTYIVERLRAALQILFQRRTEKERIECGVVLTAVAPEKVCIKNKTGWGRRVADRLGITHRQTLLEATARRDVIDKDAATLLQNGARVICKHGEGELSGYTSRDKPCKVTITVGDHTHTSQFKKAGTKNGGGGQVRHAPISFAPPRRKATRKLSDEVQEKVQKYYEENCPTSPCARDQVRRRLAIGLFMVLPAMIIFSTFKELHAGFLAANVEVSISLWSFQNRRPWNLRHGQRQTCQCKYCENYRNHHRVFQKLAGLLEIILKGPRDDHGNLDNNFIPDSRIYDLFTLANCNDRFSLLEATHCNGALEAPTRSTCINNTCSKSQTLRKRWLHVRKKIRNPFTRSLESTANPAWLQKVTWSYYGTKTIKRPVSHA
jgi:hypothetical protein